MDDSGNPRESRSLCEKGSSVEQPSQLRKAFETTSERVITSVRDGCKPGAPFMEGNTIYIFHIQNEQTPCNDHASWRRTSIASV
jgi:hypothetical protein